MDAIVAPEKMERADFVDEVETIVINSNMENYTLHTSALSVKETK